MEESQDACKRLYHRLKDIFDELVKMESKGQLPSNDALDKYKAVATKYLQYLVHYRKQGLITRVIKHQAMMDELHLINEDIDMLFKMLSLVSTAAMMEWKREWQSDQRVQREILTSLVKNTAIIMGELKTPQAQQEAILTLKFKTEKQSEQSKEMLQVMMSAMTTVIRASTVTVEKLPPWFLPPSELKIDAEPFARGSFGSVHRGVWGSGTKVVVKCFPMENMVADERAKQKIEAEMDLWYQFNHPNIIKMFGASHVSSPPFIVCEDATNGDLSAFLGKSEENKRRMWRLLYEAALGLEYLHKKSVVHGDLKLNNILVGADGHAKLSDFGMSAVRSSSGTMSKTGGAGARTMGGLRWRAPECLTKRPTFASDVYSFAMCFIEAVLSEPPFAFLDDPTVYENIKSGVIPGRPDDMTDGAWDLVVLMTKIKPEKRIRIELVVEKLRILAGDDFALYDSALGTSRPPSSSFESTQIDMGPSAAKTENHFSIADSVADFLAEIADENTYCKEQALFFLAQKCVSDEQRTILYESNGVQLLTSSVRSGLSYLCKVYALECLRWAMSIDSKLSSVDFKSMMECVQEPPAQLVTLVVGGLQNGTDDEKLKAVVRCASIATISKDAARLRNAGVVEPLVALLRNGSDTHKLWAAEALKNLSCDDEIRANVVEMGAIGPLTALLRVGTNEQKHRAALALGTISANAGACQAIGQGHAIETLVILVRNGTAVQKQCAAHALGVLALSDANRAEMIQAGAIAPLVGLLQTGNERAKEKAAIVLGGIAADVTNSVELVRAGVIAPLLVLVQAENEIAKEHAAFVLGSMACIESSRVELARAGAIAPLVMLLQTGSENVKEIAAVALDKLAIDDTNRAGVVRAGAISPLILLLETGSESAKQRAAFAIGNLACDETSCVEIVRAGAIDPLVTFLQTGSDDVKRAVAFALEKLANDDANRVEMVRAGAIVPLVMLLQSGNDAAKEHAAIALGHLACDEMTRMDMVRSGAIVALVTTWQTGSDHAKQAAALTLGKLAVDDTNRVELVRAGAIAPLVMLL